MPSILAKIVNLAAKSTETLTGKTWTDNDSNTRYAADVIAHFEDASGKMAGDEGYVGPSVVSADQAVTSIPKGTLVALDTAPTALPTTPLVERKWVQFVNEDLVDVYLCDEDGVIFKRLEPGESSDKYVAGPTVLFYGKVAAGTADTGVRAIEGK